MKSFRIYAFAFCFLAVLFPGNGQAFDYFTIQSVKFIVAVHGPEGMSEGAG